MKKLLITIFICSLFGNLFSISQARAEDSFWYDEYFEYIDENLNSFYYSLKKNPSDSVKTFELYLLIIPFIKYQGTYPRTDGVDTYYDIVLDNKDDYLCNERDFIFDDNVRYIDHYLGRTSNKCVNIDRNHQFTRSEAVQLLTEILFPEVHDYKSFGHMNNFFNDSYLISGNQIMNHAELAKITTQMMKYIEIKKMRYVVQNFTSAQRDKFSRTYGNIFDMPQDRQFDVLEQIRNKSNANEYNEIVPILIENPVTPDDIVMNAQNILHCLRSGTLKLEGEIKSIDSINKIDVSGSLNYIFNNKDGWDKENYIDLKLDGYIKDDKSTIFNGNVQFKSIYTNNNLYILVNRLNVANEMIEEYGIDIGSYIDTHLSLHKDNWMLFSDFAMLFEGKKTDLEYINMDAELSDLFMHTKFFSVKKDYGIEVIDGVELHHYELDLDEKELIRYKKKFKEITGKQALDDVSEFIDYLTNVEIWIRADDFHPYKVTMSLLDEGDGENFYIRINGEFLNSYNAIEAPEEYGEFNIIELIENRHFLEPEKSKEDLELEEIIKRLNLIDDIHYVLNELYTEEMKQETIMEFGDWKNLTDDELIDWYFNGPAEGAEELFNERWG